jgi:hypothetical protein
MNNSSVQLSEVKQKVFDNFVEYIRLFLPHQSEFLCGLYKRYQCLDNGNLVLYFSKKTHQAILRKKDYDLNHNISFERFWQNHSEVEFPQPTIITIAKNVGLPKETTRRKLSELIKQRILSKKNKRISWLPSQDYKDIYNQVVDQEIRSMAKLTKYVTEKLNLDHSIEDITNEYKKEFSFYWFHYLELQHKWMKLWKNQFQDLEVCLIFIQFATLLSTKLIKGNNISHNKLFNHPEIVHNPGAQTVSVSATSISDITGIPRATCIRKINSMAKQKIVTQDEVSKRYYINPEALTKNFVSKEVTKNVTEIFSEFYFISLKALNSKLKTN